MQLIALSGQNLFVLLLLTAVISIILGMGMPTVSVYVLTATLLAPSIVKLGVSPMAAHMYVMYFGMLSMITPPVAIAAYAAANIARVSGWTTGWTAVVVGWSTFFIPFLFVTEPSLLMQDPAGRSPGISRAIILGIFVGTAGIVGFAFAPLTAAAADRLRRGGAGDPDSAACLPRRRNARLVRPCRRVAVLGINYWQSRAARPTDALQAPANS